MKQTLSYNDVHIHAPAGKPGIGAKELLKTMDRLGLGKAAVMSWYGRDLAEQKRHIEAVAALTAECPERLYGLAWIEPRHKTPLSLLDWAVEKKGYRGFKMIPNGWYPDEDRILRYAERIAGLGVPCLFHAGILYFETFSSRFCRPAGYERLLTVPRFRFALAHIGWPWTDECLALFGQARAARAGGYSTADLFVDLTPGTPPDYREQAVERLLRFGAQDRMLFGSDSVLPDVAHGANTRRNDARILAKLGAKPAERERIFQGNFDLFFGR